MKGYYTSGEFARKANISIRTVRYYDKQKILKPTHVTEAGYRLYTDSDFAKLQKILSLKYLGFSLDEIRSMTINDEDQGNFFSACMDPEEKTGMSIVMSHRRPFLLCGLISPEIMD